MNEHELVGLYAVDALDEQECVDFEAHLAGCDSCQREVIEMSESLAQLSELSAVAPPPELRTAILSAVRQDRPAWLVPVANLQTVSERSDASTQTRMVADPPSQQPPDELAQRRNRRTVRGLVVGIAASLLLAAGAGGYALNVQSDANRQSEVAISQTSLWAAADLSVKHVALEDGSAANYAVSREQNRGIFAADSMPALEPGQVFQVWTIRTEDGTVVPTPHATFTGDGPVTVVFDDLAEAEQLALTIEPEGGSELPTTTPFAAAAL